MQDQQRTSNRRSNEADYIPGSVKQRHLEPNSMIVFTGLDVDLPTGNTHKKAFYAFDTNKLYIWNKLEESWRSVTLS